MKALSVLCLVLTVFFLILTVDAKRGKHKKSKEASSIRGSLRHQLYNKFKNYEIPPNRRWGPARPRSERGPGKRGPRRHHKSESLESTEWWNFKRFSEEERSRWRHKVTKPKPIYYRTTERPIYRETSLSWKDRSSDDSSSDDSSNYGLIGTGSSEWKRKISKHLPSTIFTQFSSSSEDSDMSPNGHHNHGSHSKGPHGKHSRRPYGKYFRGPGSHGKGKGKHSHSKHSSKSWEKDSWESESNEIWESSSSSMDSSELSDESSEERITTTWCEEWCWRWAAHSKNLRRLFPDANVDSRGYLIWTPENVVENYCRILVKESGIMCNYNRTMTNTTSEPTITDRVPATTDRSPVTERPVRRCQTTMECEADECCALRLQGLSMVGLFCTKYGEEGDECTDPDYWYGRSRNRISQACPCIQGLECKDPMRGKRSLAALFSDLMPNHGICQRTSIISRQTTPEGGITDSFVTMPTPERNGTTDPSSNSTAQPIVSCGNHMDCPFFQCCTNMTRTGETDAATGSCSPFSMEGDYCTKLEAILEQPVVSACPCQSFLKCQRSNIGTEATYGVCG